MRQGKVSESILKRSVLNEIRHKKEQVKVKAGVGQDASVCALEGDMAVATTTITLDTSYRAFIAAHRVINDLACQGGEVAYVTMNLTFPTRFNEALLKNVIREIKAVLTPYNAAIVGGHTEISENVLAPIISLTAFGPVKREKMKKPSAGDEILVTKWLGMEGAAVAVELRQEELEKRFNSRFLDKAKSYIQWMSIEEDARVALEAGASYVHNLSAGGIFQGLWDLSVACSSGLVADMKSFPMKQEIIEICDYLGLNIYRIYSGGSLLIVASPDSGVKEALEKNEIPVKVIGTITDNNDKIIINEDESRYLEVQNRDDLWSLLDGLK